MNIVTNVGKRNVVATPPTPPTNLSTSNVTQNSILLQWQ